MKHRRFDSAKLGNCISLHYIAHTFKPFLQISNDYIIANQNLFDRPSIFGVTKENNQRQTVQEWSIWFITPAAVAVIVNNYNFFAIKCSATKTQILNIFYSGSQTQMPTHIMLIFFCVYYPHVPLRLIYGLDRQIADIISLPKTDI